MRSASYMGMTTSHILMFWKQNLGILMFYNGPQVATGELLMIGSGPDTPQLPYRIVERYDAAQALAMVESYWTLWGPAFSEAETLEVQKGINRVKAGGPDTVAYLMKLHVPNIPRRPHNSLNN